MSRQEAYKGKLIPIELKGLTAEEYAKKILGEDNELIYHDSYVEKLIEEKEEFFYSKKLDTLYRVKCEELDQSYFFVHHTNEDGTIDFSCSFYNGATYLEETIEENIPSF